MNQRLKQNSNLFRASCNNAIHSFFESLSCGRYFMPARVNIRFTLRCNLKCKHCFLHTYVVQVDELDTDQWRKIITELRRWLGSFFLVISGGEPLMRSDLLELIVFSRRLKIATALNTNGTLLDERMADRLIESGLNMITVSIDGFEKTHDYLRGDGAYQKAIDTVNYLKNRIILHIHTIIINCNLDEILSLVEFAELNKIGISFQGLFMRKSDPFYSNNKNDELWPKDIEKVRHIFDEVILKKKKSRNIMNSVRSLQLLKSYYMQCYHNVKYRCQAYKDNFSIMPNGIVRVCAEFGAFGNLTVNSPKAIWNSKEASLKRKQMQNCQLSCSFLSCRFHENIFEKILRMKNIFLIRH